MNTSIDEVIIGNGVTSIEEKAFYGCINITDIKSYVKKVFTANENIFSENVYTNACLYVPEGRKFAYERATPWNLFHNIVEIKGITLDKDTITLSEGETIKLVVNINLNDIDDKDIIWTTSDSAIAIVENGVVTAKSAGTAIIKVTANSYSASCIITVKDIPRPITSLTELSNSKVYHIYQPNHSKGATSWAVETGTNTLKSNVDLGIEMNSADNRQQFAILSNDGGNTYYLYHVAESKFICMDGTLSNITVDAIKFMDGAYSGTFFAYFDYSHYINVGGSQQMIIDSWDTPDGGNSCILLAVDNFDPTEALEAIHRFTGVYEIKDEREKSEDVYDLNGRKVENPTKGIYIINGKKTFVK